MNGCGNTMNHVHTAGNIAMGKRRCRHSWIPCLLQKRKCCSIVDDIISGTGKVLVYSGTAVIVGVAVYVTGGAITTAAGAGNGIVLAPVF